MVDKRSEMMMVALLVAGVAGAAGCGGGNASTGGGTTGAETATQYAGPIRSTDTALGEQRFTAICGSCHAEEGEDLGPNLSNMSLTAENMRHQIREGSGRMRPITSRRLNDDDMEAVLAYLVTIGAVTTEPAAVTATSATP